MKKFAIIIAVLLMCNAAYSQSVDQQHATKVAVNARKHYEKMLKREMSSSVDKIYTTKIKDVDAVHVINFSDGAFMVISGDSTLNPVLGYSENGPFDENDIPGGLSYLLDKYKLIVERNREGKFKMKDKVKDKWDQYGTPPDPSMAIIPSFDGDTLVKTTWSQGGGVFNALCPTIDGINCLAGCVAIDMAQVVYYWACLTEPEGNHSYTWNGTTLSANFGTANYNFGAMSLTSGDSYNAKLIYDCGVAVDMDYGLAGEGGSSAFTSDIADALENHFGFDSGINVKHRSNYELDWESLLIDEIYNGRPIPYRGSRVNPVTSVTEGHSWVVSGYSESQEKYYCNYGWIGGAGDGWFYLSEFLFPDNEYAVFEAKPIRTSFTIGYPYLQPQTITSGSNIISIPPAQNATSYEWTTTHGTISGIGTTAILTTTESAMVCVKAINSRCGIVSGSHCEMMTIVNPEISGEDILCGYNETYTLENYDPTGSITWTKSTNVDWVGWPSGASVTVEPNSNNSGYAWVKATIEYMGMPDDEITKDFWIGNPATPTITGPTQIACGTNYSYSIPYSAVQTSTATTWSVSGNIQLVSQTTQGCQVKSTYGGNGTLTATLTNCGGSGSTSYSLPILAECYIPLAYPNPTGDILYLEVSYSGTDAAEYEFDLINNKGEKKKTVKSKGEKVSMKVSDLPEGIYILDAKLKKSDNSTISKSQQIVIKR